MDSLQPQFDSRQLDSRPNPDPTVLTTEQLERMKEVILRDIVASREIVESKLVGVKDVFDTRLEAMDKAIALFHAHTDKFPEKIQVGVGHLQRLHQQKFDSIATQFQERDTRTEQTWRDNKFAVDAALQAAKEAVGAALQAAKEAVGEQNKSNALGIAKSEATFTKQIDQIGVLVSSMGKGFDDKIDDIKGRLQAMESTRKGAGDVWAIWFAATGIAIGIGGVLITAASFIFSRMK